MTILYREDDPISARWTGLGRKKTKYEEDHNWYQITTRVAWLEDNYQATVSLASITQPTASTLLFTLTDATTFGPFTMPVPTFQSRDNWQPSTPYFVNDTFNAPDGGLYRVIFDHTSNASFDPFANDGAGHDYYKAMIPPRGNTLPAGGAVGMYLRKNSSADYDFNSAYIQASEVTFVPASGSLLTSDNVADALEELDARIASGSGVDAGFVTYSPSTGTWLTSLNVADALEELAAIDAIHVGFTPSTASSLVSTNVADALEELEGLAGGGSFLPLSGGTMSGAIELAADAATAMQPVTKQQLDGLALNLGKRGRVRAATTANITISTALNNGDALDGVTLATGDLVLVKNQSAGEENGIYVVGVSPARFAEFDTYDEHPGALIAVEEGSTNADTIWLCTSNAGGTLGTTAISFNAATVSGGLLAANNLSDLSNTATARTNLGLGSSATHPASDFLQASNNLSDLGSAATARSNLGVAAGEILVTIDGGGSAISTGLKGYVGPMPFGGTFTQNTVLADQSGSIVIDVWKCTYSQFDAGATHPVAGDKITASAPPTISGAVKSQDSTLTGWTTSFSAGDIFAFNVNSVTSITRAALSLKYNK